uniref:translational initiation factor 1 n=1 Tax=Pentaphragma spicatum TaxID=2744234 RepID=UPI0025A9DB82|nr:translational initiation factor 1 [Pentaphragma spicatum]WIW75628.1 translational initiation factor 1 [Pentaphragma spicatum]
MILDYVSGKIRRSFLRILPGDRVKTQVSRYDSTESPKISNFSTPQQRFQRLGGFSKKYDSK